MHKIDLIFILGIIIINFLCGIGDGIYQKGESTVFPIITIYGILASYVLWIVLLIYSVVTCKENKPRYVKWYMYFILPFAGAFISIIGLFLSYIFLNIFNI